MKDLLYLKDEQIKEFIQLLFYAYRETFADPKEIAYVVLFLCSEYANYINGINIPIDGGRTKSL